MALEVEQLIKVILGIVVVAAVVIGVYLLFKNNIFDFFKGLSPGKQPTLFIALLK
jgi:hypothetical protein